MRFSETSNLGGCIGCECGGAGIARNCCGYWGVNERFADVTDRIRASVQNNSLNLTPVVSSLGVDPAPRIGKILRVYYKANGQFNQGEWREGMVAQIAAPAGRALGNIFGNARGAILPLKITRAVYGKGSQIAEVGPLLQSKIVNNRLDLLINNANMGGDPAPQLVKDFLIVYEWGGRSQELHGTEGDMLRLPDGITPAARSHPP